MSKDFICEDTRTEFEKAYEEMCYLNGPNRYQYGQSTRYYDNQVEFQRQRFDTFAFKPTPLITVQHSDKSVMPSEMLSRNIPWQNIGGCKEHADLYQRYNLDTRFVPEEYRELVDVLLQLESLDTELLQVKGTGKTAVPESTVNHTARYDMLKACHQELEEEKSNTYGRKLDLSKASKILVHDEYEYNYEKFVMPKLQASLSENVSQSGSHRPMMHTTDIHQSEQRHNIAAETNRQWEAKCPAGDHASLKDEQRKESINNGNDVKSIVKQKKCTNQTTSKAEQTEKCSIKDRAWRVVQSGLVLAGSITATAFVFKKFF